MTVDEFKAEVTKWIATAKHPRWDRLYTELTYQPMLEVMQYLRANGYKTYIVTGGGQDFVRVYQSGSMGIPPEQVVGTTGGVHYGYDKSGKPIYQRTQAPAERQQCGQARRHSSDDRPPAHHRIRQSPGDQQMLEYTKAGDGARLALLVLHDDVDANTPTDRPTDCRDTKVGIFAQALYDEAKKDGWLIISMKNDWKRIFAFE